MKLPSRAYHAIDTLNLKKDIFRLITLIMGITAVLDDNEGNVNDFKSSRLFNNYHSLFEEEFSSLILNIAINTRILDDSIIEKGGVRLKEYSSDDLMGVLDNNLFSCPRSAINKIIHANYVGHDIRSDNTKPYYMTILQLLGNKGREEWCAEIYLIPFCKVLFDFAENN